MFNEFSNVAEAIPGLKGYHYQTEHKSIIERTWWANAWWSKVQTWIPTWISPNVVTTFGFFVNLMGCIPVLLMANHAFFETNPTPVLLLVYLVCHFVFNTLDNVDGLHARRLQMCSTLGEFLDHSLDPVSNLVEITMVLHAAGVGKSGDFFICGVFLLVAAGGYFFFTRKLTHTSVYFSDLDSTEFQLSGVIIILVTVFTQSRYWDMVVFTNDYTRPITVRHLMLIIGTLPIIKSVYFQMSSQLRVSLKKTWKPYFNFYLASALTFYFFHVSPTEHYLRILILMGAAICKMTSQVVFVTITCSSHCYTELDSSMLGPLFYLLHILWYGPSMDVYPLQMATWYTLANFVFYNTLVVVNLSKFLNVPIFAITNKYN